MSDRIIDIAKSPLAEGVILDPETITEEALDAIEKVIQNSAAWVEDAEKASSERSGKALAEKDSKIAELEAMVNESIGEGNKAKADLIEENEQLEQALQDALDRLAAAESRAKQAGARPTVEVEGENFEIIAAARIVKGDLKGAYSALEISRNPAVAAHLVQAGSGVLVSLEPKKTD